SFWEHEQSPRQLCCRQPSSRGPSLPSHHRDPAPSSALASAHIPWSLMCAGRVCEDGIGDPTLKIASWNVNSIRARVGHVTAWLREQQPDVLLMQELKGEIFPAEVFKEMGYESA